MPQAKIPTIRNPRSNPSCDPRRPALTAEGRVLLRACYELVQSPMALALPQATLRDAGFLPAMQDLSIERLDPDKARRAKFLGISVPMHTALRLGVRVARHIRPPNAEAHMSCYGLYAGLSAAPPRDGTPRHAPGGGARDKASAAVGPALRGPSGRHSARALEELRAMEALPEMREVLRMTGTKGPVGAAIEASIRELEARSALPRPAAGREAVADTLPRVADDPGPATGTLPRAVKEGDG